jgi:hypothetical protein
MPVLVWACLIYNFVFRILIQILTRQQENIIALREELNQGQLPEHMNTGRFAPLSIEDVGVSVATILLNPDAHRNKAYLLTGPEALTGEQQAQVRSSLDV